MILFRQLPNFLWAMLFIMAVSVLALLTNATNWNKRHRPVKAIVVVCLSKKAYEGDKINKFGFEHLKPYA